MPRRPFREARRGRRDVRAARKVGPASKRCFRPNDHRGPVRRGRFARIMESGKAECGGILTTIRGGYFVLDKIESGAELMELPGAEILDHCHIESHPVTPFQVLGASFKNQPIMLEGRRHAASPSPKRQRMRRSLGA